MHTLQPEPYPRPNITKYSTARCWCETSRVHRRQRVPKVSRVLSARGIAVALAQQSLLEGSLLVGPRPQARHVCRFPAHVALGCLEPGRLRWRHVLFIRKELSMMRNSWELRCVGGGERGIPFREQYQHDAFMDCVTPRNMLLMPPQHTAEHPPAAPSSVSSAGAGQAAILRNHEKIKQLAVR